MKVYILTCKTLYPYIHEKTNLAVYEYYDEAVNERNTHKKTWGLLDGAYNIETHFLDI